MKIKDMRDSKVFEDLKSGDVFEFEGDIFMKIGNGDSVDLDTGDLFGFEQTDRIKKLQATLLIE